MYFENYDLDSIVTPVNVSELKHLLTITKYDLAKTKFLIDSFTHGFDIGYRGSESVKLTAPNLKFREVGNKTQLWKKVMKEVIRQSV